MIMIPEVNKEYDYFDDGKIRESRRYTVKITKVIPFDEVHEDILNYWKRECDECYWLYSLTTDYFVIGELKEIPQNDIFVRTLDGGWFSLGYDSGRLDVDGSLRQRYINQ